jgi:UDP-glucose 4-epimerase
MWNLHWSNSKILITGVAGFIGSHLLDRLLSEGYDVVGIDDFSAGNPQNLKHNLGNPHFEFHKMDVRNLPSLMNISQRINAIVHLAAHKIPRYGDALKTLEVNSKGAWNVLEIARENGARVVFASSSDVYGKNLNMPLSEESDTVMGSSSIMRWSYGASKLLGEHLLFAFKERYGISITILRYFGAYGPRQSVHWAGGPQGVFIDAVLSGREIEIHGDGMQKRCFVYIDDLISGTVSAIYRKEADGQIFNIGTDEEISILKLARLIKRLSGVPGTLNLKFIPYSHFAGGRYEDVKRRVPDLSKARKLLGYKPETTLAQGLSRMIVWHKAALHTKTPRHKETYSV